MHKPWTTAGAFAKRHGTTGTPRIQNLSNFIPLTMKLYLESCAGCLYLFFPNLFPYLAIDLSEYVPSLQDVESLVTV